MRARTLFIGSFGLSLAIHALILFIPSWPISKPAGQIETYRVELIKKPVTTTGKDESETAPVVSAAQNKPKPRENPVPLRTVVEEREHDQINLEKESEQKSTTTSQPQEAPYPAKDNEEEVRGSSSNRTNIRSPGVPRDSIQIQPSDYQRILGELDRLLQERLRYPEAARRKGIEGAVTITLTLNTNGSVSNVVVSESSGSRILDRAAVRAISDIFPYPDPPDTPLHFTIPVTYRLTEAE